MPGPIEPTTHRGRLGVLALLGGLLGERAPRPRSSRRRGPARSYSASTRAKAPNVAVSTASTPTAKYSSCIRRMRSGRVRTRCSLQPSRAAPPKSSGPRSWPWTHVPKAPSRIEDALGRRREEVRHKRGKGYRAEPDGPGSFPLRVLGVGQNESGSGGASGGHARGVLHHRRPQLPRGARVLARSVREQLGAVLQVLVVDALEDERDAFRNEPFATLLPGDIGLPQQEFRSMAMIYEVTELATSAKPFLLRALLARRSGTACYLDPDIVVYSRPRRPRAAARDPRRRADAAHDRAARSRRRPAPTRR